MTQKNATRRNITEYGNLPFNLYHAKSFIICIFGAGTDSKAVDKLIWLQLGCPLTYTYHNSGHYTWSCPIFQKSAFARLDSVSIVRRNLYRRIQQIELLFVSKWARWDRYCSISLICIASNRRWRQNPISEISLLRIKYLTMCNVQNFNIYNNMSPSETYRYYIRWRVFYLAATHIRVAIEMYSMCK